MDSRRMQAGPHTGEQLDMAPATKLRAVSRSSPCLVCGGDHKCSRGRDGLIICGRRSGPQPGFVDLGAAKGDPQFNLYRTVDDPVLLDSERTGQVPPEPSDSTPPVDWPALAKQLAGNLTPALADELREQLGLPRLALDALPGIGYDGEAWTFPETDSESRIIGIVQRFRDRRKKAMFGSKRGLTVPKDWSERETPLYIVEGQSDTLALSLCAVSCIGRPSNAQGGELLAELLADFPRDRPIVVILNCAPTLEERASGRKQVAADIALATIRRLLIMTTDCSHQLTFWDIGRQQGTLDFEGGCVVTDAGLLPIRLLDHELGVLADVAQRLPDPRAQKFVTPSREALLTQEVYQILAS
jgi:hypothetical protein